MRLAAFSASRKRVTAPERLPSAACQRTLAERIQQRDGDRFVGRDRELAFLESCLGENPPAGLVLLHGPGGIGKSTLLRELARRAQLRGWQTFWVDGTELAATPQALEGALWPARESAQPLVVIDGYEHIGAVGGELRRFLLPSLPDSTVVVVASRRTPEPAWFSGGWEFFATELELAGLAQDEALRLLAARDIKDRSATAIVNWAGGSPLALDLAADAATAAPDWSPGELTDSPELVRSLLRRLAGNELRDVKQVALGVAAFAPVATPELLRAVAPEIDCETAHEQLRSLSFARLVAGGLVLDELTRKAISAQLRLHAPELERYLRRRIEEYLASRPNSAARPPAKLANPIDSPAITSLQPDAVRDALRNFGVVCKLARNPIATGQGLEARADYVRRVLREATDRAFGETENEKLLKRVLIRGNLEPGPSHEQRAYDLNLSRAAYFRRLRAAAERIAEYVVENVGLERTAVSTAPVPL